MRTFLLITLLPSFALAAQPEPWLEPFTANTQSLVSAASAGAKAEDALTVVLKEMELSYDDDGLETERMRWIYRVNTDAAAKEYAGFEVGWDPALQNPPEFRVRVIQPDGKAQELDPKTATDAAPGEDDDLVYRDRKGLRAPLPNVRVGSVIEQQIITRYKPSLFQKGTVRWFHLTGPMVKARFVVSAPAALPLKLVTAGTKEAPPKIERVGNRQRAVAEWSELPEYKGQEAFQPLGMTDLPVLYVSTGASWNVLAKAYSEIVDQKLKASPDLPKDALAAAAKAKDPLGKARALTRWLQEHVRYTGLYFGDGTVVPAAPSETLSRGFGDCKDMSTLLVAMLRASGVKAHVALLSAKGDDLEPRAPGLGMLDHAIVYVPGNKPFFVDPTDNSYPAGANIPYLSGRTTVVADVSLTNPLVAIPESTSADNGWEFIRDVYPAELDDGSYTSEVRYRGSFVESTGWAEGKEDALLEAVQRVAKSNFGCKSAESPARTVSDGLTVIKFKGTGCAKIQTDDSDAVAIVPLQTPLYDAPGFLLGSKDDESGEARPKREKPMRWPVPYTTRTVYRVHTPFGFRPVAAPEKREWKFGSARYTREIAVSADVVTITTTFDSGPRIQSASDVEAFRAEFDKSAESLDYNARFEQIASAEIAAGRVKEGLAAYRAAMTAHPKEAVHRIQYASMLLQLGFADEARRQGALATRLDPKWEPGFRVYGWILQFDDVGRHFLKGWDRAGSIAALKEAARLNPESALARRLLAESILRDEKGAAFAPASLVEALPILQEARKVNPDDKQDVMLLVSLFRAGKYAECASLAEEFGETDAAKELRVACLTAAKGQAAGFAEFEKQYAAAKRGRFAMSVAADLLIMREYEAARAFRQRYPSDSSEEMSSVQAKMLEKAKRFDGPAPNATDPAAAFNRLMLWFVQGGKKLTPSDIFYSGTMTAEKGAEKEVIDATSEVLEDSLSALERMGLPREVLKDLLMANAAVTVDLQAKHASARVEGRMLGGPQMVAFTVKEKAGWRVRAMGQQREELAAEAVERLKKNDVAGARVWLRWAMSASEGRRLQDLERARGAAWADLDKASPESLKVLAATLMIQSSLRRAEGLALLDAAKELSPDEQAAVDWAVAVAFSWSKDGANAKRAVAANDRLAKTNASNIEVLTMQLASLGYSGNTAAFNAGIDSAVGRYANDAEVLAKLAHIAAALGDGGRARKLREAAVKTGSADGLTYNNLAWDLLFDGDKSLSLAEEYGMKANKYFEGRSPATLNTLAAIHAETGRGKSAYALLIKSLQRGPQTDETDRSDWYVMGRIAESYGLDDVSRALYVRAKSDEPKPRGDDVTWLVEKRLSKLPKAAISAETPP